MKQKGTMNAVSRSVSIPYDYLVYIQSLVRQGRYEGISHFIRVAVEKQLTKEGVLNEESQSN